MNYQIYLKRCFDLARLGNGKASPNPSVGSVIIANDEIVGEGWHKEYGKAHAEVNAVSSVRKKSFYALSYYKIFVSLEPCFHFGRTPPCVDLILKENIPNVVIAFKDPNPKVAGKSIIKLRDNGVNVTLVSEKPDYFYQGFNNTLNSFFTNIQKQRPYIILKWAESADNCIGIDSKTIQISNKYTQRLVHKWRSECDGILVGTKTAHIDNPSLNNRFYFGKSPIRIVIDRKLTLPQNLNIFNDSQKTLVYTEGVTDSVKKEGEDTVQYINIEFGDKTLHNILDDLFSKKINILFVEGGAKILQSFIDAGLWDEARVIKNPHLLLSDQSGISAPRLKKFTLEDTFQLDDNDITVYKNL
jgi:diaminohydroxyphosphoribosylaminopyrimidine deaminase / 5-amino-6-(5-phosphoribosylamino)uracil reductase